MHILTLGIYITDRSFLANLFDGKAGIEYCGRFIHWLHVLEIKGHRARHTGQAFRRLAHLSLFHCDLWVLHQSIFMVNMMRYLILWDASRCLLRNASVPLAQQLQLEFIKMRTVYEIRERPSKRLIPPNVSVVDNIL